MYVTALEKIEKTDRTVGERALRLSEMLKEKLPVPPGFVINSEAFRAFLRRNQLEEKVGNLLSEADADDYRKLVEISNEIRGLFEKSEIPDPVKKEISEAYESFLVSREAKEIGGPALDFIRAGRDQTNVAVRPSPVTSPDFQFTGQTESVLNVSGLGNLLESVKLCWSSLYSPGALYYMKKKGFSNPVPMGVVVQKMVDSEKSGSVFADNSRVIIEGTWGLGKAISNGVVLPDVYVLDMETGREIEKRAGRKIWLYTRDPLSGRTKKEAVLREKVNAEVLGGDELKKIFDMYRKVSSLYPETHIVEWGIERNRVFLLHAKPLVWRTENEETGVDGEAVGEGLSVSGGLGRGKVKTISNASDFEGVEEGDIIVTKILSPELFLLFSKIRGIVSEYGGFTSNLSFLCREFGIPCVTGVDISSLNDGQTITVANGRLYRTEDGIEVSGEEEEITATEVRVNLDFSGDFDSDKEVDGVGLLRPEGLFAGRDPFSLAKSNPEEMIEMLCRMGSLAKRFYPKSVWYRSFSVRTDEIEGEWKERNPLLGWRGIRRSLEEPDILKCEIEAIRRLYSQGLNNIGFVLPFVTSVEEFRSAKNLIPFSLKLGIEVCTPSSAVEIESFCREGVNSVIINITELTQLILGVDKGNGRVSHLYSESSPAVMKLVENVVKVCRNYNVDVSVSLERCEPEVIEKLVRMGVNSISLNPEFIGTGKKMVTRVEKRLLLERMRERT